MCLNVIFFGVIILIEVWMEVILECCEGEIEFKWLLWFVYMELRCDGVKGGWDVGVCCCCCFCIEEWWDLFFVGFVVLFIKLVVSYLLMVMGMIRRGINLG